MSKTQLLSKTSYENATDPCAPLNVYQESVLAFDATTGRINWSHELDQLDAWTIACIATPILNPSNCPPSPGVDADFGMTPSFVPGSEFTPSGEHTLAIGQKNGNLYAIGAKTGKLFWATMTSPDGDERGLIWGMAAGKRFFPELYLPIQRCFESQDSFAGAYYLFCNTSNSAIIFRFSILSLERSANSESTQILTPSTTPRPTRCACPGDSRTAPQSRTVHSALST